METEVVTRSPEETRELGRRVGARLRAGDVLFLAGELGTGKTTFVQGVAEACGVRTRVRSPTFALVNLYRGRPDLFHVDLYRETDPRALEDLGWREAASRAIAVVEWPRDLAASLFGDAVVIRFEWVDISTRKIRLPGELCGSNAPAPAPSPEVR
jgi:tRNA threonylcarbamoyladenosine biosynthesis protein TsaE